MLKNNIKNEDITVVVQGSIMENKDIFPSKDYIFKCIDSIKIFLPNSKIILSTWEGENIPEIIQSRVDNIIYNKDPLSKPRGEAKDSKPNNTNRQIVSTLNALKNAKTKYSLKLRTDFYLTSNNFLDYYDIFMKYEDYYKVFEKRVLVCMFGTRKPKAKHYSLPFHVSDFSSFGLTDDLLNLYNIPLVSDYEFDYFRHNPQIKRDTYAVNRYGGEQTIVVNFLRKNGKTINFDFSTHLNDDIILQSNHFLVNNFYPISFSKYGITPMKNYLLPSQKIDFYTDYFTQHEWISLYKEYCDKYFILKKLDYERLFINRAIRQSSFIKVLIMKKYPSIIRTFFEKMKDKLDIKINKFL